MPPNETRAHDALATALLATAAPAESVEVVLWKRWELLRAARRARLEGRDRATLALLRGDFDAAIRAYEEVVALLAEETALEPRIGASWRLMEVYAEVGRTEEAAAVIADARRTMAYTWLDMDPEDGHEALRHMPETRRGAVGLPGRVESMVGGAFLAAGRPREAVRWLESAVRQCGFVRRPVMQTRAWYALGRAQEAAGEVAAAREAYRVVLDRWGGAGSASVTAGKARARLGALPDPGER